MRRSVAFVCACLVLCACLASPARAAQAGKPQVWYFFENYCDACHPEVEFEATFLEMTGERLADYDYRYFNVRTAAGKAALDEAAARFQIADDQKKLPLAIVDGAIYAGSTAIDTELPGDWLARAPSTDSVIYFLYVPSCESCVRAEQALDELPGELTIRRGGIRFPSKVVVERIDMSANLAAAQALFVRYNVPEDRQLAPIAFVRDRYYQGADDIARFLSYNVQAGGAVGVDPIEAGEADLSALSLWGSAAAGLVGGLNPCALSMLLLFIGLLVAAGRGVGRYVAAFLLSKFVVYLLIGTGLYGLVGLYAPTWLQPALRWGMTALAIALAAINVLDAVNARRERYGQIKNQLPAGLRRRLSDKIIAALAAPGAKMVPAAALLGAVVAAGEFLCAGQVYLASLMAAVQSGAQPMRVAALLAAYCAAFIAPSALLGGLAARGRAVFELSEWVRGHMPAIKLISSAALLVIVALMWIAALA
ncbi:MAG: hypothetical protein GX558_02745 [Clostridiales bacterium]|nr:hypothetical protein [Clostridiales bacterium]